MIPIRIRANSGFNHWVSPLRAGVCGFWDNGTRHFARPTVYYSPTTNRYAEEFFQCYIHVPTLSCAITITPRIQLQP